MALVDEALPTFNALAVRLRAHSDAAAPDLPRAARIRKQLTAAFADMDRASKRIALLPAGSAASARLHDAVRRAVAQYLQLHMFPLTMLPRPPPRRPPRVQSAPNGSASGPASPPASLPSTTAESPGGSTIGAADADDRSSVRDDGPASLESPGATTAPKPSIASSLLSLVARPKRAADPPPPPSPADPALVQRIAAMSPNEKMASLEVLRDQRQRVLGFVTDAQRDRRLDDAATLRASLDELDAELSLIERTL